MLRKDVLKYFSRLKRDLFTRGYETFTKLKSNIKITLNFHQPNVLNVPPQLCLNLFVSKIRVFSFAKYPLLLIEWQDSDRLGNAHTGGLKAGRGLGYQLHM